MASNSSFTQFKAAFKGDLITPADAGYDSAIERWALNAQRNARVVAFAMDEADVGLAITYARANDLPIAIRGGGHSTSGASSSEDGLVIDLSRHIKTVRVDTEKKLAYVGGGALWRDVDHEAIKFGLATVGGTVNDTGVGGLILGGGFGWLTGEYGLTIDNLVQATVVTADSSVLVANDTENPDLFWALKGGGSNFGVVTEFVLKLHTQRRTIYAGPLIFGPDSFERVVEATNSWYAQASDKEGLFQISTVLPDGKIVIILSIYFNGSEAEGRERYRAFFDIGPIKDDTREHPYEVLNTLQSVSANHGLGRFVKGIAPRTHQYQALAKAQSRLREIVASGVPDGILVHVGWEFIPMRKVAAVPRSAAAFRRNPVPNVLILIAWRNHSESSINIAREYANELSEILLGPDREDGKESSLGYSNYDADVGSTTDTEYSKSAMVFAENYPRLQEIKKRYDPMNIFNKWFPITPSLLFEN